MSLLAAAPIETPAIDWMAIAPEIALGSAAVLIVLLRALMRRRGPVNEVSLFLSFAGLGATLALLIRQWVLVQDDGPTTTIAGMVRVDGFGVFLAIVVVAATVLAVLLATAYLKREGLEGPEYYALMLLSALGMIIMTSANNLVVVFLALEILSIPLYVLAAFDRRRLGSQEAGIKYFLLGSFSSAIFLYGVALVYGATGTTSLAGIADFLSRNTLYDEGTLLVGIVLLLVGLGFKVAAVPFHMWTPDVYQGSPTPVTAFMASATKAAGFAALLRVFGLAFPLYRSDWRPVVYALAVLTMIVGTVATVIQTDVKRLLAYSSIAHAGYILIGFQVDTARGRQAALIYLLTYAFMTIGAFAVLTVSTRKGDADHAIDDYRGLALRRPVVGGFLAFFLLAQAGVPLTGGFLVKLEVFSAAVDADEWVLALIALLTTVVAAYAYLRVAVGLFTTTEAGETAAIPSRRVDGWSALVLTTSAAVVLAVGLAPGPFLQFAKDALLL